jgi:NAD(P)-dependent dehydrogenase (short-subunit alcohol dehydrogenase family)
MLGLSDLLCAEARAPMPMPATPLVALVTGASRGIGTAIAARLAVRGVRVAVHYHANRAAAEAVLAGLPGSGHALVQADLADASQTLALWDEVAARVGPVDVVVNNAGVYLDHPPLTTNFAIWQEAWRQTLATNLIGPANLSLLAAQSMSARPEPRAGDFGRGRIVNVSSRGAFRGEPDAPAYGASKGGLNALSQSLARAVAARAIYVYCVAPGWVETEMATAHLAGPDGPAILAQHPLGRVNRANEVAGAVVYCALDAPPAMTGGILDVNGASYLRA